MPGKAWLQRVHHDLVQAAALAGPRPARPGRRGVSRASWWWRSPTTRVVPAARPGCGRPCAGRCPGRCPAAVAGCLRSGAGGGGRGRGAGRHRGCAGAGARVRGAGAKREVRTVETRRNGGQGAAPPGDRRSRPDGGDVPPPAAAVRLRDALRSPHPLPGVRGARPRLPAASARTTTARRPRCCAGASALPDLVVLDLHFALPEERLLPEDKSHLPTEPKARSAALEDLRRTQGLLILERLRAEFPSAAGRHADDHRRRSRRGTPRRSAGLPLRERGGRQPQPGGGDHARAGAGRQGARGAASSGARAPRWRSCAARSRALARSPLPVLVEGETGTGKSFLAEHVIHPRSGAKGPLVVTDLSTVPAAAAAGAPVRRAPRRVHRRRRGSRRRVRAGPRRHAVPRRDRQPGPGAAAAAAAGARARAGHAPRRHAPRPAAPKLVAATNEDVGGAGAGRDASAPTSTCGSTRPRACACRRCASGREDLPDLVRFACWRRCARRGAAAAGAAYLARFPTPDDFSRGGERGRCSAGRAARRRGATRFTVFVSREALARLAEHDWPGNHRELKLFATNALVYALGPAPGRRAGATRHERERARAPPPC